MRIYLSLSAFLITALAFMGCNVSTNTFNIHDKLSGAAGSRISLSGSLSQSTSAKSVISGRGVEARAVSDYRVYCFTIEENPSTGYADSTSSGAFTGLALDNARNMPILCAIKSVASNTIIANFVFEDPNKKDMSGNTQTQPQVTLTGDTNLGTIRVNESLKTATVDITKIVLENSDEAAVYNLSTLGPDKLFDFTGTWIMGKYGDNLPTGYQNLPNCCTAAEKLTGCKDEGPCLDPVTGAGTFPIYMSRIYGYEYKNGQTNNNYVYGVMVWSSKTAFETCGSSLGITDAEAKQFGEVDLTPSVGPNKSVKFLTANGVPFDWTNGPVNILDRKGNPVTYIKEGWKNESATSAWDYWAQTTAGEVYIDENGNGWYDGPEPFVDSNVNGIYDIGETYIDNNMNGKRDAGEWFANGKVISFDPSIPYFTDSNNNGKYDKGEPLLIASIPAFASNSFYDGGSWAKVLSAGSLCTSLPETTDLEKLNKARCYSNTFWDLPENESSICLKNLQFNWRANTYDEYMRTNTNNDPIRPRSRYVFEKFLYTSPKSGSFVFVEQRDEGINYDMIKPGGLKESRGINCQIINKMEFNIRYLDDRTLIGDMKETRILLPYVAGQSDSMCDPNQTSEVFISNDGTGPYDSAADTLHDIDGNGIQTTPATTGSPLGIHAEILKKLKIGTTQTLIRFIKQ